MYRPKLFDRQFLRLDLGFFELFIETILQTEIDGHFEIFPVLYPVRGATGGGEGFQIENL